MYRGLKVLLVMAVDHNHVIGCAYENRMPWPHVPEDMRHFAQTTRDTVVIMGRKTYDSLPTKPLPGRLNIVVSRGPRPDDLPLDVGWAGCLEGAMDMAKFGCHKVVSIIGGAQIAKLAVPYADEVIQTVHYGIFPVAEPIYMPQEVKSLVIRMWSTVPPESVELRPASGGLHAVACTRFRLLA